MTENNNHSDKIIFEDNMLYEINPLAKIYHCNNIDVLITRMENAIEDFKLKAQHRTDYIEATQESILEMRRLKIWIEMIYREMEISNRHAIDAKIISSIKHSIAFDTEVEKRKIQADVDKLLKTLEWNL